MIFDSSLVACELAGKRDEAAAPLGLQRGPVSLKRASSSAVSRSPTTAGYVPRRSAPAVAGTRCRTA